MDDNEPETIAELKAANRELADSLQRCHALVAGYREALAEKGEASFLLGETNAAD